MKELQTTVDDEQRKREELRESYLAAEKRLAVALSEQDDLAQRITVADKVRWRISSILLTSIDAVRYINM